MNYSALVLFTLALLAHPVSQLHVFSHLAGLQYLLIIAGLYTLFERRIPFTLPEREASRWSLAVFLVSGLLLLFLFPMRRIAAPPCGAGDSLWLVELLPLSAELIGYWSSFDEILEPLARSLSYRLISSLSAHSVSGFFSTDFTVTDAASLLQAGNYQRILFSLGLYSILCGVIELFGVAFFLRKRPLRSQLRGFLLLFAVPTVQLFAGYIEHYAFSSMSLSMILLLVWSDLDSRSTARKSSHTGPAVISALAALAVLHHMIAGFLLPGLVYYLWLRNHDHRKNFLVKNFIREGFLCLFIALFVLSCGWYLYFNVLQLSMEGSHFLHPPVLPPHKIFSSMNVFKIVFVLLLSAPAVFAFPGLLLQRPDDAAVKVLVSVALTYGLQLAVWNPVIGLPADWDLLSAVAIPLHILIFVNSEKNPDRIGLGSLAAVTLLPALLWLQYNHRNDQKQAVLALKTAQTVVLDLKDDPAWKNLPVGKKKELMLLHLLVEKIDGDRSEVRRLLKKARYSPNDQTYTEALTAIHRLLDPVIQGKKSSGFLLQQRHLDPHGQPSSR